MRPFFSFHVLLLFKEKLNYNSTLFQPMRFEKQSRRFNAIIPVLRIQLPCIQHQLLFEPQLNK